ncbi:Solute carrier family 39 member 8 [Intoshia linei]|uniref:Solute carrier family 39 member 8 n=1 Tax=Intoshia linei TaxID=1819745 RepID=A0A177B1T6_9BILA|nr:Solute carrier family 39 member 8 [Intoshia linei]
MMLKILYAVSILSVMSSENLDICKNTIFNTTILSQLYNSIIQKSKITKKGADYKINFEQFSVYFRNILTHNSDKNYSNLLETTYKEYSINSKLNCSGLYTAAIKLLNEESTEDTEKRYNRNKTWKVWVYSFITTTFINLCALLGGFFIFFKRYRCYDSFLSIMTAVGVSALCGTSIFVLLPDAIPALDDTIHRDIYISISLMFLFGLLFLYLTEIVIKFIITYFRSISRNKTNLGSNNSNKSNRFEMKLESVDTKDVQELTHKNVKVSKYAHIHSVAWMVMVGDTCHNFMDGLSIGAAFNKSTFAGLNVSLAIFCEELPHELGDFAILISAGMTIKQGMLFNFLSASSCYIGVIIGIIIEMSIQENNSIQPMDIELMNTSNSHASKGKEFNRRNKRIDAAIARIKVRTNGDESKSNSNNDESSQSDNVSESNTNEESNSATTDNGELNSATQGPVAVEEIATSSFSNYTQEESNCYQKSLESLPILANLNDPLSNSQALLLKESILKSLKSNPLNPLLELSQTKKSLDDLHPDRKIKKSRKSRKSTKPQNIRELFDSNQLAGNSKSTSEHVVNVPLTNVLYVPPIEIETEIDKKPGKKRKKYANGQYPLPKNPRLIMENEVFGINDRVYMSPLQFLEATAEKLKNLYNEYSNGAYRDTRNYLHKYSDKINLADGQKKTVRHKPFKCKVCRAAFKIQNHFWAHQMFTHLEADRMMLCPLCPFVTGLKHHLDFHIRNHFGFKGFSCPLCDYDCVNKSMLRSHLNSHCSSCNTCKAIKVECEHKPRYIIQDNGDILQIVNDTIVKFENENSDEKQKRLCEFRQGATSMDKESIEMIMNFKNDADDGPLKELPKMDPLMFLKCVDFMSYKLNQFKEVSLAYIFKESFMVMLQQFLPEMDKDYKTFTELKRARESYQNKVKFYLDCAQQGVTFDKSKLMKEKVIKKALSCGVNIKDITRVIENNCHNQIDTLIEQSQKNKIKCQVSVNQHNVDEIKPSQDTLQDVVMQDNQIVQNQKNFSDNSNQQSQSIVT